MKVNGRRELAIDGKFGERWFVGPAALPDPAKLYDGYTPADMNPDLGDSAIVETYGLGALAVAASPLSVPSVGLVAEDVELHPPARLEDEPADRESIGLGIRGWLRGSLWLLCLLDDRCERSTLDR